MRKFLPMLIFVIILSPTFVLAAGLVPCGGAAEPPCDFNQMITLVKNIIYFLIFVLALPLAAILFAYAGWLMLSSGGSSEKISQAKHIFGNVLIGFIIALVAWLVIMTILKALGVEDAYLLLKE